MLNCKNKRCSGTAEYCETRVIGDSTLIDIYRCSACHKAQHKRLSGGAWVRYWLKNKQAGV